MPAADLYDAAAALLTACVNLLDWDTTKDRVFVSNGPPAWDCCPQLTVHAGQFQRNLVVPTPGSPSPLEAIGRRTTRGSKNSVPLVITCLRCVHTLLPVGKTKLVPPSPADLDADSQVMMSDAWILWNGLQRLQREELLFPGVTSCHVVDFGPCTPITDQGGCGGWQLIVSAQIDGSDV